MRMIMTETAHSGSADEVNEVDDGRYFFLIFLSLNERLLAG